MADTVEITWTVDDGYVGKGRPQSTTLRIEDFEDLPDDEIERLIEESIIEDFEQNISWGADIASAVEQIKKALANG